MRPTRPAAWLLPLALSTWLAACFGPDALPMGLAEARAAVVRADDEPDPVDRRPGVSDDPAEIAEVRRLAAAEASRTLAQALRAIRGDHFYITDYLWALEAQKGRAVAGFSRIMADASAPATARAKAAEVLLRLDRRNEGERFLFDAVKAGPPPLRLAALRVLGDVVSGPDLTDPARVRLLLEQVDDPDPEVAEAAAWIASMRELSGAEGKLVALLRGGRAKHPARVARELAEVVKTPEGAAVVVEYLLRERPKDYDQWIGFALDRLVASPDPKIAGPVRDAFRAFLLGYTGEARLDQSFARDLASVADLATAPVLEEILARSKDAMSRLYAVGGLARLEPDRAKAVDRLLDFARREGRTSLILDDLRKVVAESDADRVIPALLEADRPGPPSRIDKETARFVYETFGPRGREAIVKAADRLVPDAAMWVLWKRKGLDLGRALDDFHAAGVIPEGREAVLAAMRREREEAARHGFESASGPIDPADPDTLRAALSAAHLTTAFDTETDEIPCLHHRLLADDFAEGSGSPRRFAPEAAVQAWLRKKGVDDRDAPYLVRFVLAGRLYRFGAEGRGDWYDVEAVQRAANFALETSGRKERFLGLETGDQTACFVFADPAAFVPVAEKYGLPLSNDPDEPMRRGKDFERKVIEELKR